MSTTTPPDSEAQDRINMLRRRYGAQLTDEELAEVRKGVDGVLEVAKALKAVKLENSDAPYFTFAPYRKDG